MSAGATKAGIPKDAVPKAWILNRNRGCINNRVGGDVILSLLPVETPLSPPLIGERYSSLRCTPSRWLLSTSRGMAADAAFERAMEESPVALTLMIRSITSDIRTWTNFVILNPVTNLGAQAYFNLLMKNLKQDNQI
mmetsp:Transcript_843/g.1567  ORF Transcript_843/g.1567 Transcript_843/m.1567 type:complete len:137 (-) Transcript_843:861-1271(-)